MGFFEISESNDSSQRGLIFRENGETVLLTAWGKDALRVRSSFLGDIEEGSAALLPVAECEDYTASPEIEIVSDHAARITNGLITAKLCVQDWGHALQITYENSSTHKVLLREIPNGGALTKRARDFRPLAGGDYHLKVSFESQKTEKLYGMGQYQQDYMNLKGCNLELAHRNSQASVPFYVSNLGYGFLWNNAAIGEASFGINVTEWTAEETEQMDYWITAGNSPRDIERNYSGVTGRTPMMPEYGLGFWQCKLRYYNQEQVLSVAREYKRRGIPIDVIVIDYYHWLRCGDYKFDDEYFPDPQAMVDELTEMGIKLMVSIWPQVDWRSENYEEMKQKGLLVKINSGVDVQMIFHGNNCFIDATNPRTRKYVWELIKKNYYDLGIETFWLDEAEPEFTGYGFENYRYHAGPVLKVGNIYPREYARLFYEGQKESGQKGIVNLIRCAWAGSQRYGALVWSGDIFSRYEDFRKQICAGIHMGLAGIPWWTTDIGGFHDGHVDDPNFRELLIRWFEFGTFCPVMRIHGCRQPGETIINKAGEEREWTGADNEVWSFGEDNEKIMVKYIRLRERLRDYTRQLMREAHENGDPVIRAMFYEFPDDPKAWDVCEQYMYGGSLLVAPICYEHATAREVYLPAGATWVDTRNGKTYEGGQVVWAQAGLSEIPVFSRNGELMEIFEEE